MKARGARRVAVDQTEHGTDRMVRDHGRRHGPAGGDPTAGKVTEESPGGTRRFPGLDVLDQAPHWDQVTTDVVAARVGPLPVTKFFTAAEETCARALLALLTGQDEADLAVPVLEMIDARLESGETDGWRYADMPEDGQAWRDTLCYLDEDASDRCDTPFADAPRADQAALIQAVQNLKTDRWHGLPADHVWSLWTRYACTAFYAHPFAIPDAEPAGDPIRDGA